MRFLDATICGTVAEGFRYKGRRDLPGLQALDVTMEHKDEWLARTFVELADTLVADFDLIDFMSVLVERCAELLDSAEVGLALAATRGELRVMASSTERMRALELIEVQNDEGPCRDCAHRSAVSQPAT